MILALTATGIVIVALLGEVFLPRIEESVGRFRARRRRVPETAELDPGRDRRAESRARLLLKSCVNDEEWEMYRDLGFIRVWSIEAGRPQQEGAAAGGGAAASEDGQLDGAGSEEQDEWGDTELWDELAGLGETAEEPEPRRSRGRRWRPRTGAGDAPYAYLVYPHKPILAFVPQTGRLLSEHCVEFPDETRPYGSARLPDSDDVLAKWMALTGDEARLLDSANMHLPGRQFDPRQVKRDLWRLRQWERARAVAAARDDRVPQP